MRAITVLALEYYKKVNFNKFVSLESRSKETQRLILNEVTRWKIKSTKQGNNYFYKPIDFVDTEKSNPIEVRLFDTETEYGHELKFGDLNMRHDVDRFKWDDKDPFRMSKALFVMDVLEKHVANLLMTGEIKTISFSPYSGDDLDDDRLSYFKNMFNKINKNAKFSWSKVDDSYVIKRKS